MYELFEQLQKRKLDVGITRDLVMIFSKRQRITLRLLYAIGRPSVV